jgi:alkanesulfonate monooxygenase SsuD/methylene tetrahydromethanopterin reductase-like flavin-dependent oxidoreductase (luciferase family)
LGVVARYGDAWITYAEAAGADLGPDAAAARIRAQMHRLDDACAEVGRDPASVRRIYLIGNTQERPLASTAAFEDFVGRYADIGCTDLVFHHPRPDDPAWDEPASVVDEIAADVLPRWRTK